MKQPSTPIARIALLTVSVGALASTGCKKHEQGATTSAGEVGAVSRNDQRERPEKLSSQDLERRMLERRAVDAAVWGMPIVSFDAMREAYMRDAGAKYNDIVFFSKPADWKFQITTPNSTSNYVYVNYNTKSGPVVVDIPPAGGVHLFGTLMDAWQTPLADVGPRGEDKGKGARYLLLPPGFEGKVPLGYLPLRMATYNGYATFRSTRASSSEQDARQAVQLIKKMRVYPLEQAGRLSEQRYIDISGKKFDAIVDFDERFYTRLARILEEEPVQQRDLAVMGQIAPLGIIKGKPFNPTGATLQAMKRGASEAHTGFVHRAREGNVGYWPGSNWGLDSAAAVGKETHFSFMSPEKLDVDSRAQIYFLACAAPATLGAATFYLSAFNDADGKTLNGDATYRLHVPPNVPADEYWAVTVYDSETAGFLRSSQRVGIDSFQNMRENADGSVDLTFSSEAPRGAEANWVYTAPGKNWFSFFRFYGPRKAVFDKSWKLPNFERVR